MSPCYSWMQLLVSHQRGRALSVVAAADTVARPFDRRRAIAGRHRSALAHLGPSNSETSRTGLYSAVCLQSPARITHAGSCAGGFAAALLRAPAAAAGGGAHAGGSAGRRARARAAGDTLPGVIGSVRAHCPCTAYLFRHSRRPAARCCARRRCRRPPARRRRLAPRGRMNPISQFFILSPRGDTIVTREFRGDVPKGAAETFFRKARAGPRCCVRAPSPARRRRRHLARAPAPAAAHCAGQVLARRPAARLLRACACRARVTAAVVVRACAQPRPCSPPPAATAPSTPMRTRRSTASTMWRSKSRRCI